MAKNGELQSKLRQSERGLVSAQLWQVPDCAFCRAIRFGGEDDMVYCLMEDAHRCGYALRFGSGFFCHHPKRGEIMAQTTAKDCA